MDGVRGEALLADVDQWVRCRHENTVLVDGGGVMLDWKDPERQAGPTAPPVAHSGLAVDARCVAYRSDRRAGTVVAVAVFEGVADDRCGSPFDAPSAVAVDRDQRLYVAERGAGRVAVMDLASRRVLRRVPVGGGVVDLATRPCGGVLALTAHPARLVALDGRRDPVGGPALHRPWATGCPPPARLAVTPDGLVLVLWRTADGDGVVATADGTAVARDLWGAVDLDVTPDGVVVVGLVGPPLLRRFQPAGDGWTELEPLAAAGFDGGAIAVAPGGRIVFTTERGIGRSGGVATRLWTDGRVLSYRLDSRAYRTRWGRMFLDACIPPGTAVDATFVTSDDDEEVGDPIAAQAAARSTRTPIGPTPPLPSQSALRNAHGAAPLFRRPTGRERPWAQIGADDGFETYEVPVDAPRGRYLWVALRLTGTSRTSPRVREVRIERPGHTLLDHLPRSWSRDEDAAAFLQRFLAPAEGLLHEMDVQSDRRDLLVDPRVAPQEVLPWLAGFVGLVLDRRWSEHARRRLIARAYPLMRRRGTLGALTEMLETYLGRAPVIVERWRLRGGPGAVLGTREGNARSVLGTGLRVSGNVRRDPSTRATDGFAVAAHRFCVLIPQELTAEQRSVVRSVVDRHKPAHTTYEISEVGSGMLVGRRLHLGLTAVVGPPGGVARAVAGSTALGSATVGAAAVGSRLGRDTMATAVRVG